MGGETMLISVNIRALCLKDDWAGLERLMATHMREMMDIGLGVGDTFGTMIAPEDFMKPGTEQILSYYCTKMERPPRKYSSNQLHQRPCGRYLVTYFAGDYMETASSYELLRGYMQDHDLEPAGYAYEESLIEEMGTPDPDEFITRIAVPVRTGAGIP